MKKLQILFVVAFLFAFFLACKHEIPVTDPGTGGGTGGTGGGGTGGTGGGGTGSSLVCFESDILPIFQSNCAKSGCHDAASHQEGYILDNYNNILNTGDNDGIVPYNASNSEIYEVLFETGNDKMPKAPNPDLTSAQKALIGRWINEGARNTTNCGTSCDETQFRFTANIKPILTNNCIGCHNSSLSSGGHNFTTYDGVRSVALSGRLYGAITHSPGFSPMPQNANKLSDCQIAQFRNWIAAGAPNN